jgi:hypothetical protein
MRLRYGLFAVILTLFCGAPLAGQEEKQLPISPVDTRPAQMLLELNKASYAAKRAVPASDNIFIENGRVIEALFTLTRQENPVAIPAGQPAVVSKVILLDKAIHVFFQGDKCALLILTKEDQKVSEMTVEQLLDLARKGLTALFTVRTPKVPT